MNARRAAEAGPAPVVTFERPSRATRPRRARFVLFTVAAFAALLPWVAAMALSLAPRERPLSRSASAQGSGGTFSVVLPEVGGWRGALVELRGDSVAAPRASRLRLLRDGRPLGAPHQLHESLRLGVVGWSHWGGTLIVQPGEPFDLEVDLPQLSVIGAPQPRRWTVAIALFGAAALALAAIRRFGPLRRALDLPVEAAGSLSGPLTDLRAVLRAHRPWWSALGAVALTALCLPSIADAPAGSEARWLIAGVLALLGAPVAAMRLSAALRRPIRVVAVVTALYAASATINAPRTLLDAAGAAGTFERLMPPLALALGAVAWFRPSALILLAAAASWRRVAAEELTGFPNVSADWLPLAALALLFGSWIALEGARILVGRIAGATPTDPPSADRTVDGDAGERASAEALLACAVALQFGHYVASAIEKLRIGSAPLDWILRNPTEYLLLAAEANGAWSPAGALGRLDAAVAIAAVWRGPLNMATFLLELAPLMVVFLGRRWITALLLAFAALHVAIWSVTGIGFWKWIVADVALAIGVASTATVCARPPAGSDGNSPPHPGSRPRARSDGAWGARRGVLLLLLILLQPRVMEVVRLGWHDTPALNRVRIEAILDDGRAVAVPASFFASGSYRMACGVFPRAGRAHFPTETWATTDDVAVRDAALRRAIALEGPSDFAAVAAEADLPSILRRHHAWALERVDEAGRLRGRRGRLAWPHHIVGEVPASLRGATAFDEIDLRRVVAYRAIAESIWLRDPATLAPEEVVLRGELLIPLAGDSELPRREEDPRVGAVDDPVAVEVAGP
ncbi:MAG TPA: hypothetical protein PKC43_09135 [Phycisphaerales bacterium]|nr:hypothetical protein [Phycisphaerales bacterium]HMP37598.1 hypothetical protein [Phycisphaerales bacterium]